MKTNFINIWCGEILPKIPVETLYWALSKEEKLKASSFTHLRLKQKYIQTRGVLKKIVASYYSDTQPQNISIKTGKYGKPFVTKKDLHFNLSHTKNRYVIVISNVADVGVDLEHPRARVNITALVNRCFSKTERLYWNNLPEDQKITMFYRFWVRKEAFVKAIGRGIAVGLDQCIIDPNNQSQLLSIPDHYGSPAHWNILDINLADNVICAVATKAKDFHYKQTELNCYSSKNLINQ